MPHPDAVSYTAPGTGHGPSRSTCACSEPHTFSKLLTLGASMGMHRHGT
uniref:Uncharacterized protein n=1 Tax=Arundo donax TaxID=35708 RepID=A0A0A9CB37_ARUDO